MRKTLTSIRFLSDGIRVKDKWNSLISDLVVEPTNSTGPLSGTTYIVKDNIALLHLKYYLTMNHLSMPR